MNFNFNVLTAAISVMFYYAPVFECAFENTGDIKWFLLNTNLFYINSEQELSSPEAQRHCLGKGMTYEIVSNETSGVSEILKNNFGMIITKKGFRPSFWMLEKKFLRNTDADTYSSVCNALDASGPYAQSCTVLKGVICKTEIFGGSLKYKNGTHVHVGIGDVNRFCTPQSNEYDELLDFCMIKFTQRLL